MATVLQIRFPAGRYHATPWEHHVNEGMVEWPPSPWRLLRCLLATGFCKTHWGTAGPPPTARSLVESLAASLPAYWLPAVALGHSRHYVDASGKKPLIIDTWGRIDTSPDAPIEVQWDIDLPEDQRRLLNQLAPLVGYLGRAESWVEIQVASAPTRPANCIPATDDEPPDMGYEAVRVMCAQSPADYSTWRQQVTDPIENQHRPGKGRKLTAAQRNRLDKALAPFPGDLIDALMVETGWLQSHRWSAAPGSRNALYWRRGDALEVSPPVRSAPRSGDAVAMALLALSTPSRSLSALPMAARTYAQGRLLHKALASQVDRHGTANTAKVLLGRENGRVARDGHRHAHLLHLDLDGDQHLDHVLVWAPALLDATAQRVLRALRRTWMKGGAGELGVALAGLGGPETLRQAGDRLGGTLSATLGPPDGAHIWQSATPFIAPRFTKRRGRDSIEGQVLGALARRGLPPARVELLDPKGALRLSFRHYVLHDARHRPPVPATHAVRLTFEAPVTGPLCLGYGSHYGLGRFEAMDG